MLSDHKRIGKKFIPPFIAKLGPIGEVKWAKQIVPEILWLGLLNECFGFQKGARLSLCLPKVAKNVVGDEIINFSFLSSYVILSDPQKKTIMSEINHDELTDLRTALSVFKHYGSDFPLSFIFEENETDDLNFLPELKNLLNKVFDRKSVESTIMQADAIYISLNSGRLKIAEGLSLAEFPKIQDYPSTEISREIASSIRATLNILASENSELRQWPINFWNRGFELEECAFYEGD